MNEEAQAQQHCGPDPRCGDAAPGQEEIAEMFTKYKTKFGDVPSADVKPSRSDQHRLCK